MERSPFAIKVERTLASEPRSLAWCPTMDLLALVAGERQLGVHRLSWQRLFTIAAFEHNVTAIAWRPDGKMVCVGLSDGSLSLLSVEDGALLQHLPPRSRGMPATVALAWHEQAAAAVLEARAVDEHSAELGGGLAPCAGAGGCGLGPCCYVNELGLLFAPLPPLPAQPGRLLDEAAQPGHAALLEQQLLLGGCAPAALDLLAACGEDGALRLLAAGGQLLARVRLGELAELRELAEQCERAGAAAGAPPAPRATRSAGGVGVGCGACGVRVLRVCLSACLGEAVLLLAVGAEGGRSGGALACAVLELPLLRSRAAELQQLGLAGARLGALLGRLRAAVRLAAKAWEEGSAPVLAKLRALGAALAEEGEGDGDGGLQGALLECLLSGGLSAACETWLGTELSEAAVGKLLKGAAAAGQALGALCTAQLLPAAEMAAHVLHALGSLLGWEERFGPLGLRKGQVEGALRAAWRVRAAAEHMAEAAGGALAQLSSLVAWLGRLAQAVRDELPGAAGGVWARLCPDRAQLLSCVGALPSLGELAARHFGGAAAQQPGGAGEGGWEGAAGLHGAVELLDALVHGTNGADGGEGGGGLLAPTVAAVSACARLRVLQPLCALPPDGGAAGSCGADALVDMAAVQLAPNAAVRAEGADGLPLRLVSAVLLLFPIYGTPLCDTPTAPAAAEGGGETGGARALGLALVTAAPAAGGARSRVQLGRLELGGREAACAGLYERGDEGSFVLVGSHAQGGTELAALRYAPPWADAPFAPSAPEWPVDAGGGGGALSAPWVARVPRLDEAARVRAFGGLRAERLAVSGGRGLACLVGGRRVVSLDLEDEEDEREGSAGEEGEGEGAAVLDGERFLDATDGRAGAGGGGEEDDEGEEGEDDGEEGEEEDEEDGEEEEEDSDDAMMHLT